MRNSARGGRVVGLGLCLRDEVLLEDDFALVEQRTRYRTRLCLPGGMVTNALATVAAEGLDAHLLSMVGRDRDGQFVSGALRRRAVRKARDCGATVVADFADARAGFRRLLPHIDYPVVPLDFVRDYGEGGVRQTLIALHRRYGGTPAVILGEKGALALHAGRFLEVPPVRVRVVDTTGAGDAFHGAFFAGLALGFDVDSALRRASRSGAAACCYRGGMPSED